MSRRSRTWPIKIEVFYHPSDALAYARLRAFAAIRRKDPAQVLKELVGMVLEDDAEAHANEAECAWRTH